MKTFASFTVLVSLQRLPLGINQPFKTKVEIKIKSVLNRLSKVGLFLRSLSVKSRN